MVFGAFSEISEEARKLLCYAADLALLKNRLYRRWGINTPHEYARIKIYVLRLFFGKPDFTRNLILTLIGTLSPAAAGTRVLGTST